MQDNHTHLQSWRPHVKQGTQYYLLFHILYRFFDLRGRSFMDNHCLMSSISCRWTIQKTWGMSRVEDSLSEISFNQLVWLEAGAFCTCFPLSSIISYKKNGGRHWQVVELTPSSCSWLKTRRNQGPFHAIHLGVSDQLWKWQSRSPK